MKFSIAILLTALLSFAASLYLPWWSIAICAFLVSVIIRQSSLLSFLAAFFSLIMLWGIHAAIIDVQNHQLLSSRVAAIFPLGGSSLLLLMVTAFIGGIVAGLSALCGSYTYSQKRISNPGLHSRAYKTVGKNKLEKQPA